MKTLWKRSLALLLCLILCGSLLPVHALAEGETEPAIPEEESAVLPEEDAPVEVRLYADRIRRVFQDSEEENAE